MLFRMYLEDGTVCIAWVGVHGSQRPTTTMIDTMAEYLVGKDPLQIEHHWQYMFRMGPFRGSVISGAVSDVDIALGAVKGKWFEAPVLQLLGGKVGNKIRLPLGRGGDRLDPLGEEIFRRDLENV